jgi:transmembrane sensor
MSNLVAFPDPRKAREEASLWLAKLDRGLTNDERSSLREWLQEGVNNKAFLEMGKLWRGLDVISVLSELFPLSPEVLNPPPRRSALAVTLTAVAAACIASFGTIMLTGYSPWTFLSSRAPSAPPPVMTTTYATAIGESRVVKLADGSVITLNTNSRVTAVFSPRAREVFLAYGEASFDVAHEPTRPFNVNVGKRVFQAVGTSFNVRVLNPENVELTVTEGRVKLLYVPPPSPPDTPAKLREEVMHPETTVGALETALVEPGFQTVRKLDANEVDARLAWQRGMIIFEGEPLGEVLAEVDRYTTTQFVLGDEKLRDVRVGGYFRAGDVDGLLVALRENFLIDSRRDAQGRVVLTALPTP